MRPGNRELLLAFLAVLILTGLYLMLVFYLGEIPRAPGLFGHLIGSLGFLLMLATEILYSLRKRSRRARWGRLADWLSLHIFTGIVGPFMVLLHTAWRFNGLAGIVTLLAAVVVASGFVGRYLYTAVPRSADGMELSLAGVVGEEALRRARRMLALWHSVHIPLGMVLFTAAGIHIVEALYYATLLR